MATVTITLTDTEAGVEQEVHYAEGFNQDSPAHFMSAVMLKLMQDEIDKNNVAKQEEVA